MTLPRDTLVDATPWVELSPERLTAERANVAHLGELEAAAERVEVWGDGAVRCATAYRFVRTR